MKLKEGALPQDGRKGMNPAEGVWVGGWSGDEAPRRADSLPQVGRKGMNPAEGVWVGGWSGDEAPAGGVLWKAYGKR